MGISHLGTDSLGLLDAAGRCRVSTDALYVFVDFDLALGFAVSTHNAVTKPTLQFKNTHGKGLATLRTNHLHLFLYDILLAHIRGKCKK